MLKALTDKELVTLALTFGINNEGVTISTHEQSKISGVSSTAVRRRLIKALDKLNKPGSREALELLAKTPLSDLHVTVR